MRTGNYKLTGSLSTNAVPSSCTSEKKPSNPSDPTQGPTVRKYIFTEKKEPPYHEDRINYVYYLHLKHWFKQPSLQSYVYLCVEIHSYICSNRCYAMTHPANLVCGICLAC